MKVVYKRSNKEENNLNPAIYLNSNCELLALNSIGNPLKAIYTAVETCIIRQLYPENFQFHA